MVNHISPASPQFQDYVQNGEASHFSSMFVKWADIWPQGVLTQCAIITPYGTLVRGMQCLKQDNTEPSLHVQQEFA
jgi:hypothetical protein